MVKTLLIVEDNADDILLLCRLLPARGPDLRVVILRNGDEAIRFIEKFPPNSTPCAVLLDFHLSGSDGLEVLRAIRRTSAVENARVIVLTIGVSPRDEDAIRSLGAACRVKPFGVAETARLASEIAKLCADPQTVIPPIAPSAAPS